MNKKVKNKDIKTVDIKKYLAGEASNIEKYEFEKQLLEQPFEAEATDGFEQLKVDAVNEKQVFSDLKSRLDKRVSKKQNNTIPLWQSISIAASVLLVVSFGGYYLVQNIGNKQKISQVIINPELESKNKVESEQEVHLNKNPETKSPNITYTPQPAPSPVSANIEKTGYSIQNDSKIYTLKEKDAENEALNAAGTAIDPDYKRDVVIQNTRNGNSSVKALKDKNIEIKTPTPSENKAAKNEALIEAATASDPDYGKVLAKNKSNLPPKSETKEKIIVQAAPQKPSEVNVSKSDILLEASTANDPDRKEIIAINERKKAKETAPKAIELAKKDDQVKLLNTEPRPKNGWVNYDNYLINSLKSSGSVASLNFDKPINYSLTVEPNGKVTNIKIENTLSQAETEKVTEAIENGPKWLPARKKGKKVKQKIVRTLKAN
jgi:predicted esterase YcpF (UPF0227 family)